MDKVLEEIRDEDQYDKIVERIEELLNTVGNDTPMNDRNMVELDLLSSLVEEYEELHYTMEIPALDEMIRLLVAEMGLSQKGLTELLGVSPPCIIEYMSGKSEPTLKLARFLHQKLGIDAGILLG